MKRLITYLLALTILTPFLGKTALIFWFKVNQQFIAKELCVNRNNKDRQDCAGCCYLDKQLKKLDEESQTPSNSPAPSPTSRESSELFWFSEEIQLLLPHEFEGLRYTFGQAQKSVIADPFTDAPEKPPMG